MNVRTREEYIEWYINYCGSPPKPYLLDKYYPQETLEVPQETEPDPHDATEKDKEEFWEGVEPENEGTA
jgi:hypothetical protein